MNISRAPRKCLSCDSSCISGASTSHNTGYCVVSSRLLSCRCSISFSIYLWYDYILLVTDSTTRRDGDNVTEDTGGRPSSRAVARELWRLGYFPLVVRAQSKAPAVRGFSGHSRPDRKRMEGYIESIGDSDPIAVSLPLGVIGVDVDTYEDKPGGVTLCALEDELGELPDTWVTTRRGAPPKRGETRTGIYLYQLPAWAVHADGEQLVKLASSFGLGIETVQYHERIAVCAPTALDGMEYRWWGPGEKSGGDREPVSSFLPASVTDLPVLPDAWVWRFYRSGLTFADGRPATPGPSQVGDLVREWNENPEAWEKHTRKMRTVSSAGGGSPGAGLSGVSSYRAMGADEALQWASARIAGWEDEPNEFMRTKTEQLLADFGATGSRHDYTRDSIWHAIWIAAGDQRLGKPANPGGGWAVQELCARLIAAREHDAGGSDPQVREEIARMVVHGIAKLRGEVDSGRVLLADDIYGASSEDYSDFVWTGNPDGESDSDLTIAVDYDGSESAADSWSNFDYAEGVEPDFDFETVAALDYSEIEVQTFWEAGSDEPIAVIDWAGDTEIWSPSDSG